MDLEHLKNIGDIIKTFLAKFLIASIDLLGFGESSQPSALLDYEPYKENSIKYSFDLWSNQVSTFCSKKIQSPVYLVGTQLVVLSH